MVVNYLGKFIKLNSNFDDFDFFTFIGFVSMYFNVHFVKIFGEN